MFGGVFVLVLSVAIFFAMPIILQSVLETNDACGACLIGWDVDGRNAWKGLASCGLGLMLGHLVPHPYRH